MPRDVIQIRSDAALRVQLDLLADKWGGIKPLPVSQVVREAVRRALEGEARKVTVPARPRRPAPP
jgi:hypothetical protein